MLGTCGGRTSTSTVYAILGPSQRWPAPAARALEGRPQAGATFPARSGRHPACRGPGPAGPSKPRGSPCLPPHGCRSCSLFGCRGTHASQGPLAVWALGNLRFTATLPSASPSPAVPWASPMNHSLHLPGRPGHCPPTAVRNQVRHARTPRTHVCVHTGTHTHSAHPPPAPDPPASPWPHFHWTGSQRSLLQPPRGFLLF